MAIEGREGSSQPAKVKQPRSVVFQPVWGIRGKDSIMGNTKLARVWSLRSIPPIDYKDFFIEKHLEGIELLGSQAHAAVSFLIFLLQFFILIFKLVLLLTCFPSFVTLPRITPTSRGNSSS